MVSYAKCYSQERVSMNNCEWRWVLIGWDKLTWQIYKSVMLVYCSRKCNLKWVHILID